MTMKQFLARTMLVAGLGVVCLSGAYAQGALRPEVGKPLAKARQLLAAHSYAAAMAQVRLAAGARGLTANESFIVEEMRGAIAQSSGDLATASKTYADMIASGRVPAAEIGKLYQAEASMAYSSHNYAGVISWTQKYLGAGGSDPAMRNLLITAYYQQRDYANAARLQKQQVDREVANRQRPSEEQLQLLARCQLETGDKLGFGNTMVQLVTYYPKPDYWQNLIHAAQTRPGYNNRLDLDIDRFELTTGLLKTPTDLMEMTELALQAPLPGEAKAILDAAFAAGTLGTGPEASRQQRLRDLVNKTYDSELKALPSREADANSSHEGNLAASLGEEYASYGQFDKAIPLLQLALKKDSLRHPDDIKLHLGLVYMKAGQKAAAVQTLRSVGGKEGQAEIARLWILHLGQR
jgi:hypothetical protein